MGKKQEKEPTKGNCERYESGEELSWLVHEPSHALEAIRGDHLHEDVSRKLSLTQQRRFANAPSSIIP